MYNCKALSLQEEVKCIMYNDSFGHTTVVSALTVQSWTPRSWYTVNIHVQLSSSRGVVASAPDFERADEGSILTAGLCFKSGKSECNNSGYKLTGLTWWP